MDAIKRVIHVVHQTASDAREVVVQLDLDRKLQQRYDELYQTLLWCPEWSVLIGEWLGETSIKIEKAVEQLRYE